MLVVLEQNHRAANCLKAVSSSEPARMTDPSWCILSHKYCGHYKGGSLLRTESPVWAPPAHPFIVLGTAFLAVVTTMHLLN